MHFRLRRPILSLSLFALVSFAYSPAPAALIFPDFSGMNDVFQSYADPGFAKFQPEIVAVGKRIVFDSGDRLGREETFYSSWGITGFEEIPVNGFERDALKTADDANVDPEDTPARQTYDRFDRQPLGANGNPVPFTPDEGEQEVRVTVTGRDESGQVIQQFDPATRVREMSIQIQTFERNSAVKPYGYATESELFVNLPLNVHHSTPVRRRDYGSVQLQAHVDDGYNTFVRHSFEASLLPVLGGVVQPLQGIYTPPGALEGSGFTPAVGSLANQVDMQSKSPFPASLGVGTLSANDEFNHRFSYNVTTPAVVGGLPFNGAGEQQYITVIRVKNLHADQYEFNGFDTYNLTISSLDPSISFSVPASGSAANTSAVPEPSTALLVLLGAAICGWQGIACNRRAP